MSTFQGEPNSKMGLEHSATVQIDSADIRIVKEQYIPEHRFAGAHPLVLSEKRECEYEHEPKQYIPSDNELGKQMEHTASEWEQAE